MAQKKTKRIYDEWGDELENIVLDNGSSICRAGFAGEEAPRVEIPALVAKPRYESIMVGIREQETFIGNEFQEQRELLTLNYPIKRGIVTDWDNMEEIWRYVFKKLDVPVEEFPVLLSEPALNPMGNREKAAQVMFETFGTPAFYSATQAILSMYASGRGSGVVCESGDGVTHIVPVYEGYMVADAVQRVEISGRDVTHLLAQALQGKGYSFTTTTEMEIVKDMKEKLCYLAQDPHVERNGPDLEKSYQLPDGTSITLGEERFRCPEALFQPSLLGLEKPQGLHHDVFNCIMKCDIDMRKDIFCNIITSGGNTLTPGFDERLKKEIRNLAPVGMKVNVVGRPERLHYAFIGGSILASLSTFEKYWISKQEYDEHGPHIVHQKCCT